MMRPLKETGSPLWAQIADTLVSELSNNKGSVLLTEAELSQRFNVSRSTIRQALQSLKDIGLVKAKPGKGTFLNLQYSLGSSPNLAEVLLRHGFKESSCVIESKNFSLNHPPRSALSFFGKDSQLTSLVRLRLADTQPVALVVSWMEKKTLEMVKEYDLTEGALESIYLKLSLGLTSSNETITARLASLKEQKLLKISKDTPLLIHQQELSSFNKPVEFRITMLNSKLFKLSFSWNKLKNNNSVSY